jgi:hypothetical protein
MFYWHPILQARTSDLREQLKKFEQEKSIKPVPQLTLNEKNLQLFFAQLGEQAYVEQQIKTMFAIAEKHELKILQAEYKSTFHTDGKFYTYQMTLPLKGNYVSIRHFAEEMLLNLPFASLDEMSIKRETINAPVIEVKLRFSLFLQASKKTEID